MTSYAHVASPWGSLFLTGENDNLTGVYFSDKKHVPKVGRDWVEKPNAPIFTRTVRQLNEYAAGKRKKFDLPFEFHGTPFQLSVWKQIAAIPFGRTITYGDIAKKISSPTAVRAVGAATGANPIAIVVPCHRVIGKDGSLTGFAGGMNRKIALLNLEAENSDDLLF